MEEETTFKILGLHIPDHVLLTASLTILIFLLGFLIRAWINKINSNINLKRKESLLIHFLSYFDNRAGYQIKALKSYANQIELSLHRNFIKVPTFEFDYFSDSKEEIFRMVFERKFGKVKTKTKIYQGVLGTVKVFKETLIDIFLNGDQCNKEIEFSESKRNEILNELYKLVDSLKLKKSKSKLDTIIIDFVTKSMIQHDTLDYRKFVLQLNKIAIDSNDSEYEDLLHATTNYHMESIVYDRIRLKYSNYFTKMSDDLEDFRMKLLNLSTDFQELKSKPIIL